MVQCPSAEMVLKIRELQNEPANDGDRLTDAAILQRRGYTNAAHLIKTFT